jgi:antitoxin CptB|tara:strand:- start:434 stop:688 length:255 start_codon:yes stop_codon:yes gene_type:complete
VKKLENLKKKIIYRSSYRGTKEMDLLLSAFVKYYIESLSINDLFELEKFLNFEDEVIGDFYFKNKISKDLERNRFSSLFKKFKF